MKIKVGYRFGKLEVVGPSEERKNGYMVWRCRCDCGNEILVDTRTLQRGTACDCGCETKVPAGASDLSGRHFGRLTAVSATARRGKDGSVIWECCCECGKTTYVPSKQLVCGYTRSCGCLGRPPLKEFTGKRFGNLTVLAYEEKRAGMHRWRCLCDCGRETVVGQTLLQTGKTKSCGCLQMTAIVDNLKLVDDTSITRLEASKKHRVQSNTSGHTGVYWNKKLQKWAAQITFKKKTHYLGAYERFEDAVKARERGEEMHEDFLKQYYQKRSENDNEPINYKS